MKKYTITSKAGMTPFSTAATRAAAEADSIEARQLGLDGEIIEELSQKSYQQITGDGTTDRAVGGDNAPASPAHTPEPWTIRTATGNEGNGTYIHALTNGTEIKQHLLGKTAPEINANAARICACVNACQGMHDPAAQIKALRDALADISLGVIVETGPNGLGPVRLDMAAMQAIATAALKGATK